MVVMGEPTFNGKWEGGVFRGNQTSGTSTVSNTSKRNGTRKEQMATKSHMVSFFLVLKSNVKTEERVLDCGWIWAVDDRTQDFHFSLLDCVTALSTRIVDGTRY